MLNNNPSSPFWQLRWVWVMLALGSTLPFVFATVPPLGDLSNHVGRYFVFLNADSDPFLQQHYSVQWSIIGNLGGDLLVRGLGPWLGAELATRLMVALIPLLTVAAVYALSRALQGEATPSALLAALLCYSWPLYMGFSNFCLTAPIALLFLALWIRIRAWRLAWRMAVFVPLSFLTWLGHTAGWGLLGLGVLAYELSVATEGGRTSLKRLLTAAIQMLAFLPTVLFVALWRQRASAGMDVTMGADFWRGKLLAVASLFRESYAVWDLLTAALFAALLVLLYLRNGRRLHRPTAFIAAAYLLAFLACPQVVFNSAFADRRLLSFAVLMLPLSFAWPLAPTANASANASGRRSLQYLALACLALFVARVGVSTWSWHQASESHERRLSLLQSVPVHSRIFSLVLEPCEPYWARVGRPDHLPLYALPRRISLVNGMFQNPGLNQVEARFADAGAVVDPNMISLVHDQRCPQPFTKYTLQSVMRDLPRARFDYVWLISPEALQPFDESQLKLVATLGHDRLYQIEARQP